MRLEDYVATRITALFQAVLDFAQVACPEAQFKPLRSKILRQGNDCIRDVLKFIQEEKNASKEGK